MSGFARSRLFGASIGVLALGIAIANLTSSGSSRADAGLVRVLTTSNAALNGLEACVLGADDKVKEPLTKELAGGLEVRRVLRFHQAWVKPKSQNAGRIEHALNEETEMNFTDNPLEECLNYLEDLHHIEIIINNSALFEARVNPDTQITLNVNGVSLKSGLRLFLEPLALDYVIKDEVLWITTSDKIDKMIETRVYTVSRLKGFSAVELAEIISATIAPHSWVPKSNGTIAAADIPSASQGKGVQTGMLPGGAGSATAVPVAERENKEMPKAEGCIRCTGKSLVIRQTVRIHDEIVELLDQLEDVANEEPVDLPLRKR